VCVTVHVCVCVCVCVGHVDSRIKALSCSLGTHSIRHRCNWASFTKCALRHPLVLTMDFP